MARASTPMNAVPAVHGDVVHHVLVDELVPEAHARLAYRIGRAQGRRIGKRILQVFVDDRRVRDDGAVMIEHRNLALGIDREEGRLVLLELVQIDINALERQALFLERDEALERVGAWFRVVKLEQVADLRGRFTGPITAPVDPPFSIRSARRACDPGATIDHHFAAARRLGFRPCRSRFRTPPRCCRCKWEIPAAAGRAHDRQHVAGLCIFLPVSLAQASRHDLRGILFFCCRRAGRVAAVRARARAADDRTAARGVARAGAALGHDGFTQARSRLHRSRSSSARDARGLGCIHSCQYAHHRGVPGLAAPKFSRFEAGRFACTWCCNT